MGEGGWYNWSSCGCVSDIACHPTAVQARVQTSLTLASPKPSHDVSTDQTHTTPPAPVQESCGIYQTKQVISGHVVSLGEGVHVCSVSSAVHIYMKALFYRRFGESCKNHTLRVQNLLNTKLSWMATCIDGRMPTKPYYGILPSCRLSPGKLLVQWVL